MVSRGAVSLLSLDHSEHKDRPMDFADAVLIRTAEREGIHKICTVDRKDFLFIGYTAG
jgi:predicted nucleic acid-binding protein